MVRRVARCMVCLALSSVLGCRADAPKPTPPAGSSSESGPPGIKPKAGLTSGTFTYVQQDGVPLLRWDAPDGKQVILLRVDVRWVCEQSGEQLTCGSNEAATTVSPGVQLDSCPCVEKACAPMCRGLGLLPGLHDAAPARATPKP
jgi:hypothetical protein